MKRLYILLLAIITIVGCRDPFDPNEATRNPLIPGGTEDTVDHRFSPDSIHCKANEYFNLSPILQWGAFEINPKEILIDTSNQDTTIWINTEFKSPVPNEFFFNYGHINQWTKKVKIHGDSLKLKTLCDFDSNLDNKNWLELQLYDWNNDQTIVLNSNNQELIAHCEIEKSKDGHPFIKIDMVDMNESHQFIGLEIFIELAF